MILEMSQSLVKSESEIELEIPIAYKNSPTSPIRRGQYGDASKELR